MLNEIDEEYKDAVQCLADMGENHRQVRYNDDTILSVNPVIHSKGEKSQSARGGGEPLGIFFETYRFFLGKYAIYDDSLPAACVDVGAEWQFYEETEFSDDNPTWENLFILAQPKNTRRWYDIQLAKFITNTNLAVTYDVGQGTYSESEGNQAEDTTPATFTAVVSQQQRPRDLDLSGTPASALYVEGYHISPQTAPDVPKQQRLSATLTNPNGTLSGEFIVLSVIQPPVTGKVAGTGDVVKGFFVARGL